MAPRWGLAGHLEATWGVTFAILGGFGSDLCKKGRSIKMTTTMAFRLHFRDLGVLGSVLGGCWRLLWAILVTSWPHLGDLGVKMGTSWQHGVSKVAEDGLRQPI